MTFHIGNTLSCVSGRSPDGQPGDTTIKWRGLDLQQTGCREAWAEAGYPMLHEGAEATEREKTKTKLYLAHVEAARAAWKESK